MSYLTFIDPTAPYAFGDPNFSRIGANPFLFWGSIGSLVVVGHSPYLHGRPPPLGHTVLSAALTTNAINEKDCTREASSLYSVSRLFFFFLVKVL